VDFPIRGIGSRNSPPFDLDQRHTAYLVRLAPYNDIEQSLESRSLRPKTSRHKVGSVWTFTRLKEHFRPGKYNFKSEEGES
jgi:hypothetical protein